MNLNTIIGDIGRFTRDAILVTTAEALEAPLGPAIVWCNAAFTTQTGYTLDEVRGRTPRLLQGPDTPRRPLDKVRAALEAWRPVQTVVMNYRKNGEPFFAELSIQPVADETGWYVYWVAVQREVTDRVRQEMHLKARFRKLHESELALQQEKLQLGWDGARVGERSAERGGQRQGERIGAQPQQAVSRWIGGPR